MRRVLCFAAAAAVAVAAVGLCTRWSSPEVPALAPSTVGSLSEPGSRAASSGEQRRPVPDSVTEPAGAPQPVAASGFEALAARLIELTVRGMDEYERGDTEAARATDVEVRAALGEILGSVPDYEQRALFGLTGVEGKTDHRSTAARTVYGRLLHLGLQKLAGQARAGARPTLDRFLCALLEVMVPHQATASVVAWLLTDNAYLGVGQEDAVLRLAQMVPTYTWLAEPVRRLLLTLWNNLEASGARARDQIETLALMLKDDTNEALRAAALERLVASGERELVEFVVRDVEERRDGVRAGELALAAAGKLPAAEALAVARRLRALAPSDLVLPAMEIARRDEASVRASYESLRVSASDGPWRADLVSGLGFNPTTENLQLVARAFQSDPDVEVRVRALMALTASAAASLGQEAMAAALDDPDLCGRRGERLGILVGALSNLMRAGEREAAERLGRRLAARRDLPPVVRAELEQLLREGPSRPR